VLNRANADIGSEGAGLGGDVRLTTLSPGFFGV
jgi:hypothetical protein